MSNFRLLAVYLVSDYFYSSVYSVTLIIRICNGMDAVAVMLRENKTYAEIAKATHASTATISRVGRTLNYGNDGYDLIIERMKERS